MNISGIRWRIIICWLWQCCGSGFGIRGLFDPWIRDPGWVKNPDPGWTTWIIFSRAWKQFFWVKMLKLYMRIRDPGMKKLGSGIRDKHPGSATLNTGWWSWWLNPGSFLCGDPGPLALGAVLAYRSGDHRQSSKHVKALLELSTHVRYPERHSSGFRTLFFTEWELQPALNCRLPVPPLRNRPARVMLGHLPSPPPHFFGITHPPTFPPPPPLSPLPYFFSSVGVETKENLEWKRCVMRVAHKIFL